MAHHHKIITPLLGVSLPQHFLCEFTPKLLFGKVVLEPDLVNSHCSSLPRVQ